MRGDELVKRLEKLEKNSHPARDFHVEYEKCIKEIESMKKRLDQLESVSSRRIDDSL